MAKLTSLATELRPWSGPGLLNTPAAHNIMGFYLRLNFYPPSLALHFSGRGRGGGGHNMLYIYFMHLYI